MKITNKCKPKNKVKTDKKKRIRCKDRKCKKNYNSKREDLEEESQREDERNVQPKGRRKRKEKDMPIIKRLKRKKK